MGLPKIMHPTFNVTIPSTKQKIRMRPFLVKEEKILLMAQTSENPKDIVLAIQQVVNNCLVDDVQVESLTTFDIEYLFLKLRGKSVSGTIELKYTDPTDEHVYNITVNVDDVEVKFNEDHTDNIKMTEHSGIVLKYPKADMAEKLGDNIKSEVDLMFELMKYCIDKVYDENDVHELSDYTDEQITEFVESLDISTFQQIQKFIETMPKLYHEVTYKRRDGSDAKLVLQTLNDFFTLR